MSDPNFELPDLPHPARHMPHELAEAPIAPGAAVGFQDAELAALSEEERAYLAKHAGHDGQHLLMVLILMVALIGVQVLLLEWRKRRPKAFTYVSLAGLVTVPLALAVSAGFTRFVTIWFLFAAANGWVIFRASRRPISSNTPKLVYRWFAVVYQLSYALGILGYVLMVLTFFGVTALFTDAPEVFGAAVTIMFYGIYFGVLARDLVEVISDHMASAVGYYAPNGLPQKYLRENVCAVCGDHVALHADDDASPNPVHQLACRHLFHEQCIRGWTIIGKRDCCPYCKEKVDLSSFTEHPWDKAQMYYLQLIDAVRYLVVWQPLIFLAVQGVYKVFGLE
ncbi:hypothetical protein GGF32_003632 [Allomyces javanicus]|nr:hypothetical protein GGF32_003632 [Allomyces javanicus]